MTSLLLASFYFFCLHLIVPGTALRGKVSLLFSEAGYLIVFSLLSLLALVWLTVAYQFALTDNIYLWRVPRWLGHPGAIFVGLGFLFVVIGAATPNRAIVRRGEPLDTDHIASGILTVTRHPVLWGIIIWALYHLVIKGTVADTVFFGTFAVIALLGTFSIDRKRRREFPDGYAALLAVTSNIPFVALMEGRVKFDMPGIGLWRIGLAIVCYLVVLFFHYAFTGVPPVPL